MSNRYAIIKDGLVANVAIANVEFAATQGWVECPDAGPGWTYANGTFTAPIVQEPTAPAAPTKEQLLAQLNALSAQIQALE